MVFRATPQEREKRDGKSRKAALKRRVRAGVPIGLLGYVDREPVMWCSIAPRSTYRRIGGAPEADADENVWSIVCFFIARPFRGQGATARLIEAAVTLARRRGATVVEAYPVDPGAPSYRFMGYTTTFEAAGFREVTRAGTRRHVMQRRLNTLSFPPSQRSAPGGSS
jgi:GNAT superfamily N-acetyltransferase